MREPPHVVILGGGFGGLTAARALKNAPLRITLVDERNHHLFQPLLYQVATAGLNPSDIAAPIRGILRRQQNVEVLLGRAEAVDVPRRVVRLSDGELAFDYLIVATGTTHAYFGNDAWAADAPGLKTVEDALEMRRRILFAFEAAEREDDPAERRAWLTFVVVGGGPTGVELAGALGELARHSLARDFRRIDPRQTRVVLCEAAPRVLGTFAENLSAKAARQLARLGVEVMTGAAVEHVDADGVVVGGERIAARVVLWAAGVAASPLARSLAAPLDSAGRVLVADDLSLPGSGRVFVIGDLAAVRQADGTWVPGMAPAAIQQARHVAAGIRRSLRGLPRRSFRYRNKGVLATIGRAAAVAQFGRFKLSGWLAWWFWLVVHIIFLIGFRNRVLVLLQWTWAYWTFQRGARLITGPVDALRRRLVGTAKTADDGGTASAEEPPRESGAPIPREPGVPR